MISTQPIGVFDSGLGGLNVLKELRRLLPGEDFAYLADNRNSPYGTKTKNEIIAFLLKAIRFFENLPAKLIVFACNTASVFLDSLKEATELPLLGVVGPTVAEAKKAGRNLAVLATAATIESGAYQRLLGKIRRFRKGSIVYLQCSEFVTAIERGLLDCAESRSLVKEKLSGLSGLDTIVLACTHFELYRKEIREVFPEARLVSSGMATAESVKRYLKKNDLLNPKKVAGTISLYITGEFSSFRNLADWILNGQRFLKADLAEEAGKKR